MPEESRQRRHVHRLRAAANDAAFFLPYLEPGMHLLDAGCGPGTITVGLAKAVAPGEVTGFDLDEAVLEIARAGAAATGLTNVRFEVADIHELPIPDNVVDAVFSNAVIEYVDDPVLMLKEMYRVLKPGGVIGVRTPDTDGELSAPEDPLWEELRRLSSTQDGSGHIDGVNNARPDRRRGKHLRSYLRRAGFVDIRASASYTSFSTREDIHFLGSLFIPDLQRDDHPWIEAGLVDRETLQQMVEAAQRWTNHPDAFMARAWGEAVAWKN